MKGYVQVYTGEGKGKTTAAFGLCLRAAGAGLKVYIGQFLKKGRFNEHRSLDRLDDLITVRQFGMPGFILGHPTEEDVSGAVAGLSEIEAAMKCGIYDVIIIDEINVAVHYGLVPLPRVLDLIRNKAEDVELVLTGRYAPQEIIDMADLVTEMRLVKHYHANGVSARKGIER